jgi:hypothetical protein
MGDEKVQIAFYGTRDLRRRLKRTALERGTSVQDLIEQAITRDFNTPEKADDSFTIDESTVPVGTVVGSQSGLYLEAIHKLVDFVYASGVESLTTALTFTLEGFAAGARLHTQQQQQDETTSSAVPQEEERTEALLRKAREAGESARRVIEDQNETGSGNPGRANEDNPAPAWRRRA